MRPAPIAVMNEKSSPSAVVDAMPEVFVSRASISAEVTRRVAQGRLRKIASRLYTRDLDSDPEDLVRRNLWSIAAGYFPGALIADRTAFELQPAEDASVCMVTPRGADIELPGVVLRPRRGAPPIPDDRPFLDDLRLSSRARACLDNLRPSRARGGRLRRTLSRGDVESQLERLVAMVGEGEVSRLRETARRIAPRIDRAPEFVQLDAIVGALVGTQPARLSAPTARARVAGRAYDPRRLDLLGRLHAELLRTSAPSRPTPPRDGIGAATLAFFEAYFSNYIEGTEFTTEEAVAIIFGGRIPDQRPTDAHDVLGVWRIVSDAAEMRRVPETAEDFLDLLRARHRRMLSQRPEAAPGQFKTAPNRVGAIEFVHADAVVGTLERSFEMHRTLDTPFSRAVFMHFLVSEVHPFADGNGRVARIMMNADLVAGDQERIVIPTVYRDNYIAGQRALTVGGPVAPMLRMLDFAWNWTAAVRWGALDETMATLRASHAFHRSGDAERLGLRLAVPSD
ncbi:MAG: Fic family protein [Gammaproteobacteria bacterium]|nr:Fic family protein [Gammaproteobacteria bacterium]